MKTPKTHATVINWGEIEGPKPQTWTATALTRGDDEILTQELRDLNQEEPDDDGEHYWRLIGIAHLPRTTIVEWQSGRGHHATTQICWIS